MADLLNRQAGLMKPRTGGTTGSFLQDKPENAIEPDMSAIAAPVSSAVAAPVTSPTVGTSVTVDSMGNPIEDSEPTVESDVATMEPQESLEEPQVSERELYENELDSNLSSLLEAQAKAAEEVKSKKNLLDSNLEALSKGGTSVADDEDVPWDQVAEDTFWAGARGFNQGVGWLLDLVPTGVLQGVELVDNYLLDDQIDTSRYQYVVQRAMNDRWGTIDAYKKGAVSEVAADVSQAVPTTVVVGGSLARYGLNQMLNGGVINQYAAPYALRLGQSLGIDVAAIAAGETAEELVEEVAGEDSTLGTVANIGTSIFTGATVQRAYQSNAALQKEAADKGVKVLGEAQDEASNLAVVRDKLTEYLTQNVVSKTLWKGFAEKGSDWAAYADELRLMGKSGKAFLRERWNTLPDTDRAQFFANMEVAAQMGLKLTPYELLGDPQLRPLALATARITPDASMKRIDENLKALDAWVSKDAPDISEAKRDLLKASLSAHNKTIEESVQVIRDTLVQRKQDLLDELAKREDAVMPADIGERFKAAVTEYQKSTTAIFGKQFDNAVDKEVFVNPKTFTGTLKDSLEYLGKGTFTLPTKAGRIVNDLLKAATPQDIGKGMKAYAKVTVGDLMDARNSFNKALVGLNPQDPMFRQNKDALFNAISAVDDTLATVLPQESKDALVQARKDWATNVGKKFGAKETAKLTTVDSFNNPFYNGQEMLEVLFSGSDKETRARAYADFLRVNSDHLEKFAEGNDVARVVNAAEHAKLSVKQYVVNQLISEVAQRRNTPVEEVVQGYMQRNQAVLSEVLDEIDFDPGKLFRDVERGLDDMKKAEEKLLAQKLFLGGNEDADVFDLKTYLQKHVLENKPEADRLIRLMNSPEEMEKLGYTKEAVQEMFASTLVRDIIGESADGRVLDTNLKKLLDKAPSKLEELIGAERVDHMKKFLVGHKLATRFTPSEVTPRGAANLDKSMAQDLGLGMVPAFISDRMIIAKRMASAEYIMALRAVKVIGGLKSEGYRKYMTKVMTDPKFFLEAIKWDPKNYGDVKRIRLYLAAQGIDTSILNNEQAQQQVNNLETVAAETEGSVYDNDETRKAIIDELTGVSFLREAQEVEKRAMKGDGVPELLRRTEEQQEVSEESIDYDASMDPLHEVSNWEGTMTDDMNTDEATKAKATAKFQDLRSQGFSKEEVRKIIETVLGDNNNRQLQLAALDEAYGAGE